MGILYLQNQDDHELVDNEGYTADSNVRGIYWLDYFMKAVRPKL